MERTRAVQLTDDQVAFLQETLEYTATHFRNHAYEGMPREFATKQRQEKDEMISSVRLALRNPRLT